MLVTGQERKDQTDRMAWPFPLTGEATSFVGLTGTLAVGGEGLCKPEETFSSGRCWVGGS